MANLDMKKTLKHLYAPSAKAVGEVDVPPMNYLMIDGKGNPNTSKQYEQAVQALYNLAYAIRAICKDAGNIFTVMPLEGLWSFEHIETPDAFTVRDEDKDKFIWTMMILQPDFVTSEIVEQARDIVQSKKDVPERLNNIRFEAYHEGEAVQIMHIGSYSEEGPTVERLHRHIETQGWALSGKHHEIYLSDPRKVAPEKLKTVIRQPFKRT